jgi:23S rRNA (adenine2503-C2)-methyltransferase
VEKQKLLLDLGLDELRNLLTEWGEPAWRAKAIFGWVWRRQALSFDAMSDLPASLRERLGAELGFEGGVETARSEAPDGTTKLLLSWQGGGSTETVMIPAPEREDQRRDSRRRSVCLSTQVGCDVGCRFCASGIGGSMRNLSVGEVLEQALRVSRGLGQRGERLSHVVFMGMGEPLANYDTTVAAARALSAPWGAGIAQRRITISTVGLPKQIERLAGEGLQVTLALSLHAPDDALRRELIPWAKGVGLERLLAACRHYFDTTGREITFEYCLLAGVNDHESHARALAEIARDLRAHVNVMAYNPVEGLPFERPSEVATMRFLRTLRGLGANAHFRHSRGLEADAACGQLRRRVAS